MPKSTKSDEEKVAKKDALFWDTFQSWADKLAKGHDRFRLMGGHSRNGRAVGPEVTNLQLEHQFPSGQSFLIQKVGIQIVTSDDATFEVVQRGLTASLDIVNRCVLELPATLAWVPAATQLREDEEPRGLHALERHIAITERQNFQVTLEFNADLAALTRHIEERVGPGSAWYSIAFLMWGEHRFSAY